MGRGRADPRVRPLPGIEHCVRRGAGTRRRWLEDIQRFLPRADLTIFIDIAPETAAKRKAHDRDRYERDLALLGRVRESYRRQAAQPNWVQIDGERSKDQIAEDVSAAVTACLKSRDCRDWGLATAAHAELPRDSRQRPIEHARTSALKCPHGRPLCHSAPPSDDPGGGEGETSDAPASFSALAHASSVAPVVLDVVHQAQIRGPLDRSRSSKQVTAYVETPPRRCARRRPAANSTCGRVCARADERRR